MRSYALRKNIHARVKHLVQKYGTRDPVSIAGELGIEVVYKPYSNSTKGYFIRSLRNKYIIVNSTLCDDDQRIVASHELGHSVLHPASDIYFIREHTLFPTGPYEIEANKFAAELLIDDHDIDKYMLDNLNAEQIANYYGVPKELVEYKFDI